MVVARDDDVDSILPVEGLVQLTHALRFISVLQRRRVEAYVLLDDDPRSVAPVYRGELLLEPLVLFVVRCVVIVKVVRRKRDQGQGSGDDRRVVKTATLVRVRGRGGLEVGDGGTVEGLWSLIFNRFRE